MRKYHKMILIIMFLSCFLFGLNTSVTTVKAKYYGVKILNIQNYTMFYNAISNCITNKQTNLAIKITNYNEKTYNINNAIKLIINKNKNLKFVISGINSKTTGSKIATTINYSFDYIACDYIANNIEEFGNSVAAAIKSHRESANIKINNYDKNYNLNNIYNKLTQISTPNKYTFGASTIFKLSSFSNAVYKLKLDYRVQVVSADSNTNFFNINNLNDIKDIIKGGMRNGDNSVTLNINDINKISFEDFNKAGKRSN